MILQNIRGDQKVSLFNFYFIITKYWFEVSKLQTAQLFDNQALILKLSLRSTIKRTRCWNFYDLQSISGSLFGQAQAQLFDNKPLILKISLRPSIKRYRGWSVSDLQPIFESYFGQPKTQL